MNRKRGAGVNEVEDKLEEIKAKRLLVVMPHPDDETVTAAGLMNRAHRKGWQVKVVSVTNGVLGRINVHGRGRSMVQIRREELSAAMEVLGVDDFGMWRYCDGLLREIDNWKQPLAELVAEMKPGLVVSYGPSGASGHPDHIALGKFLFDNLETLTKGVRLWWPTFGGRVRPEAIKKSKAGDKLEEPDLVLKLEKGVAELKRKALLAHESQDLSSPLAWLDIEASEWFAVAKLGKRYDFSYVEFDLGD